MVSKIWDCETGYGEVCEHSTKKGAEKHAKDYYDHLKEKCPECKDGTTKGNS